MSETSTATISSAITAVDKQSWPLTPQCKWTAPELSLGVRLGSMDVLGRYKCWQVLENSPADLVWKAVSIPIKDLLEDQHEHLNARDLNIGLNMFMIGRKPASSNPTILFSCQNKAPRQKAMELVAKKGLLTDYPGVMMAESSRIFKMLGLGSEDYYRPAVYVSGSINSCGTPILVSAIDGGSPRKATMGGIVCVDGEYCGLTAAHPFLERSEGVGSAEGDLEFAFYGQEDPDDNSSTEEDTVDITGMGSISSASSLSEATHTSEGSHLRHSVVTPDPESRVNFQEAHAGGAKGGNSKTESKVLGNLFAASIPNGSLDWALVSIADSSLPNLSKNDYSLVNKVLWNEKVLYPENLAPKPADVKVIACTGSYTRSPFAALQGTLSGVVSFSKLPGSTTFQELWMVKLDDGNFYNGDCGSWIIDFETGDVYGHVVSGYPATDTAYIIPATQIFSDMERTVEKPVKLSTREMRASFQRRMKESTTNSGTHEASNITSTAQSFKPATFHHPVFDTESIDLEEGAAASVISIPSTYITAVSMAGLGSLPVSKEDTSLTAQAWNLLLVCYKSDVEEFRDISGELCSLHIILKDVIEALENDSFNLSPTRADSLEELLDQVEDVLAELESEVLEYNTMDTATRQKWQVKGWGLLAVSVIQQRIIYIITTLNAFLSAMKDTSHSRIRQIILRAIQELRRGYHAGSILNSDSNESLETQQAWAQLKEQIELLGSTKTDLAEEEFVVTQIQRAVDESDLKESVIPDGESALSPNFSSSSTAAEMFEHQITNLNSIYKGLAITEPRDNSTKIQAKKKWSDPLVKSLIGKLLNSTSMALLEAANEGDLVGLIKLVKKGVKITTTDKWDWTALHMAAYHGHENILIFLINEGLDVDARTFDNETPLELALKKGHVRIARIIEKAVKHRADQTQV